MVRLARRWDGLAVVQKRLRKEGRAWIREPDSKEKEPVDGAESDQAEDSGPPLNADCLKYNDTILWEMFHCWCFKPKPTVDKIEAEVNALFEISEYRPHPKQAYKDAWTLKRLWGYAQRRQRAAEKRNQTPRMLGRGYSSRRSKRFVNNSIVSAAVSSRVLPETSCRKRVRGLTISPMPTKTAWVPRTKTICCQNGCFF
ncbi:unnamed protein product [Durusdinium trenchii]|uniref:Uncharacterized protein n=1 Tax=Durusdinium trenchii TaxID=1381693 RepID=A0ABP0T017_9DINO